MASAQSSGARSRRGPTQEDIIKGIVDSYHATGGDPEHYAPEHWGGCDLAKTVWINKFAEEIAKFGSRIKAWDTLKKKCKISRIIELLFLLTFPGKSGEDDPNIQRNKLTNQPTHQQDSPSARPNVAMGEESKANSSEHGSSLQGLSMDEGGAWSELLQCVFSREQLDSMEPWLNSLFKIEIPMNGDRIAMAECFEALRVNRSDEDPSDFMVKLLEYNRIHETRPKYIFHGPIKLSKALWSEREDNLLALYASHDPEACNKCQKRKVTMDKAETRDSMWEIDDEGVSKLRRKPRNETERQVLLSGVNPNTGRKLNEEYTAEFLVQDNCPLCHGQNLKCECVDNPMVILKPDKRTEACEDCPKVGQNVDDFPVCYSCLCSRSAAKLRKPEQFAFEADAD